MDTTSTTNLTGPQLEVLTALAERDGWHTIYRYHGNTVKALADRGLIERGELTPVRARQSTPSGPITFIKYDFSIRITDAGREALQ